MNMVKDEEFRKIVRENADLKEKLKKSQEHDKALNGVIKDLTLVIREMEGPKNFLENEVERLNKTINHQEEEIGELKESLEELYTENKALEKSNNELKAGLKTARSFGDKNLKDAYEELLGKYVNNMETLRVTQKDLEDVNGSLKAAQVSAAQVYNEIYKKDLKMMENRALNAEKMVKELQDQLAERSECCLEETEDYILPEIVIECENLNFTINNFTSEENDDNEEE